MRVDCVQLFVGLGVLLALVVGIVLTCNYPWHRQKLQPPLPRSTPAHMPVLVTPPALLPSLPVVAPPTTTTTPPVAPQEDPLAPGIGASEDEVVRHGRNRHHIALLRGAPRHHTSGIAPSAGAMVMHSMRTHGGREGPKRTCREEQDAAVIGRFRQDVHSLTGGGGPKPYNTTATDSSDDDLEQNEDDGEIPVPAAPRM
jgi:hypothetical protein